MNNNGAKKYAVITAADHATGLGTARALSGNRINIIGICSNKKSLCCRSNVWDRLVIIKDGDDKYIEKLIQISTKIDGKCVLFACQDNIVQLISDKREVLNKHFEFVLPQKKSLNMLMDKAAFHDWASLNGFSVPESHIVETYGELNTVLNKTKYPVILKPFIKSQLWELLSPVDKVFKLTQKEELENIKFNIFEASSKIIVQQWIPGRDSDVHFCLEYFDRQGQELAYYTGQKIFQWPVDSGSTAAAVGTKNNKIHELTKTIFKKAEFCGLGSIEFKKSETDKKYYIIEPTVGRNDLQSYIAVAGGVNISKTAFYDAINKKINFNNKREKGVWIAEEQMLDAIRYQRARGFFRYNELFQLLSGGKSYSLFNFKDPKPFLNLLLQKLKHKL